MTIGSVQLFIRATLLALTFVIPAGFASAATGTLSVVMEVDNTAGEGYANTAEAHHFDFRVNGGPFIQFEADRQNDITVEEGTYTVTQEEAAYYATTLNNCTNVVVPAAGTTTCTITKTYTLPSPSETSAVLTIFKSVINDNSGSSTIAHFGTFLMEGSTVIKPLTHGIATTTPLGSFTIRVTDTEGYTTFFSGDCEESGEIVLSANEIKSCFITHDDFEPPMSDDQEVTTEKNTSVEITLTAFDNDGDTPLFATTSDPLHGMLSGIGAVLLYTPEVDSTGTDSFTFAASDATSTGNVATVTITVNEPEPVVSTPTEEEPERRSSGGGERRTARTGEVLGTSTSALTEAQIKGVLDLLKVFGADQATVDTVTAALYGKVVLGTSTAPTTFIFTQTLQVGSTGSEVSELQKRLTAEGFYSAIITGYFGVLTEAAVMKYQAAKALPRVGIIGPLTRAALNGK